MSDCGCEKARESVYDLLRGELCAEESAPIRDHLEGCPECRQEERVCSTLTEVLRRACEEDRSPCPEELRGAILSKLRDA